MDETGAKSTEPGMIKRLVFGRNPKRTLIRAFVVTLSAFILFKYVLLPIRVEGSSMDPTYEDRDINFINLMAYVCGPPQRGDVVGLKMAGRHVILFKRIVGLPGETISIDHGEVHINGSLLPEPYVKARAPWQLTPRRLGTNEYFVIGDNRGMAQQSHSFGAADRERIIGKALW